MSFAQQVRNTIAIHAALEQLPKAKTAKQAKALVPMLRFDEFHPASRTRAIAAFCRGDVAGLLCSMEAKNSLAFVFDNMVPLMARGMYEKAVINALTGTRTNNHDWETSVILWMLGMAKPERLRELFPLPGPGPFTVYRGICGEGAARKPRGLSWSASLDIACWFACFIGERYGWKNYNPAVVKAKVTADEVYAYTDDRGEAEFVTYPKRVTDLRMTEAEIRKRAAVVENKRQRFEMVLVEKLTKDEGNNKTPKKRRKLKAPK